MINNLKQINLKNEKFGSDRYLNKEIFLDTDIYGNILKDDYYSGANLIIVLKNIRFYIYMRTHRIELFDVKNNISFIIKSNNFSNLIELGVYKINVRSDVYGFICFDFFDEKINFSRKKEIKKILNIFLNDKIIRIFKLLEKIDKEEN